MGITRTIFPKRLGKVFDLSVPTEEGGNGGPWVQSLQLGGGGITRNLLREGMLGSGRGALLSAAATGRQPGPELGPGGYGGDRNRPEA